MLVASVKKSSEIPLVAPLADLVELRLDCFEIDQKPDLPCIFTFRKKEEGGKSALSEEARLKKMEQLLYLHPEYLDIEASTDPAFIAHIAQKFPRTQLIGSYHNFETTPQDLDALLDQMRNPHFSIYKIALQANCTSDMLRLMLFCKKAQVPLAAISMGPFGAPSRVLAKVCGSALDYAGLDEDGELFRYSLKTLHELFHYRSLNSHTRLYALIGDSVEQSPGELFHNPRFQHNAVYVKLRLPSAELLQAFQLIRQLPFGGLSVTIPHKEAILPLLDAIDPEAQAIGAVNTVAFRSHKAMGFNTDGLGALNAMEAHLSIRGKRLSILGAGGTAKAIAYEAKKRGAFVSIFNRTESKARALAESLGIKGYGLSDFSNHRYDILVNTIPPSDPFVLPLQPCAFAMDAVYSPRLTPLLASAQSLGNKLIYGEEMFAEQALLQQQIWRSN